MFWLIFVLLALALPPGAARAAVTAPSGISFGGAQGSTFVPHRSGDVWEWSEDLVVLFPQRIKSSEYRVTIRPSPLSNVQIVNPVTLNKPSSAATTALQIRWNKAIAQTYTVSIAPPDANTPPTTVVVRTAPMAPEAQAPIRSARNEPYYYGSLEHSAAFPYGLKLPNSGRIDPRALAVLGDQGVRFVRFGPTPTEVASHDSGSQSRTEYSFASTDPTIVALHERNITTLYVIDAANPPKWGNPNTVGDKRPIFETPDLYAEYCRGVASHIATALPWVTRAEIGTNEPNFSANWQNGQAIADGMPQFADKTGAGLALYAKACYAAIKKVAPQLQVVAPGVAIGSTSYSFLAFLDHMYANGCKTGTCWDILSVHSYSWGNPKWEYDQDFIDNLLGPGAGPGSFYSYRSFQNRALRDGEAKLPKIMITEMGYTSIASSSSGVDPTVQAFYLSEAFNQYLADPNVVGLVYADILNHERSKRIFAGISTLDDDMLPKPVWSVYNQFATQ